jgi:SAM-dependent methyltransferase
MKWLLASCLFLNASLGVDLYSPPNPPAPLTPVAGGQRPSPNLGKGAAPQRYSSVLKYDRIPPGVGLTRTNILNTLVQRYGHSSYLEIGLGLSAANFDWVRCRTKVGVDPDKSLKAAYPMTSDEFFAQNKATFDLIFIDGLHHADQVERDILNALQVLNENGSILVHDCNPTSREMQVIPRSQRVWTGDVWKAWVKLRSKRPDLKMYVINAESGCGLIRRGRQATIELPETLTYEGLAENREKWLNLVEPNAFLEDLKRDPS